LGFVNSLLGSGQALNSSLLVVLALDGGRLTGVGYYIKMGSGHSFRFGRVHE